MRTSSTRLLCGTCALAVLISACSSDSTGPKAAHVAIYYDSLYEHLEPPGQLNPLLDQRARVLTNIEIATAFGATPRSVTVTTASGTEHWHGVELVVNPNGTDFDFSHWLIVYRETDAHTALMVDFAKDGSARLAVLEFADTLVAAPYTLSGSASLTSQHDGCVTPPTLTNPAIAPYRLASCATATFTTTISEHFGAVPGLDPSLATIELGPTIFEGELFTSGFGDFPRIIGAR